jgi:hypothetical protein
MKKEQIFRILNANKRMETFSHKPKENLLKVLLYSYTGRRIIKTIERIMEGLKQPLELVFKPVKSFTKKDLAPSDATTQEKNYIINDAYKHTPIQVEEKEPKNRTHQQTSIKYIDKDKNVSQFNPDEYFF